MSRLTDTGRHPKLESVAALKPEGTTLPPLPPVDWKRIGKAAPVNIPIADRHPDDPLPAADIVVVTWTNAEWSAFDHVFCNSDSSRTSSETQWQNDWQLYTKGAPQPPPPPATDFHLWGYFRMVQITGLSGKKLSVLLFKAQTHLAYDPYLAGLITMTQAILSDTGAACLYSIGTAGGVDDSGLLGNTVITNSGYLRMTNPKNDQSPLNNQLYTCKSWFPSFDLVEAVQKHLLYPLSNVASWPLYNTMFTQLEAYIAKNDPTIDMSCITVDDLVNKPLNPVNLHQPQTTNCRDFPLLTTDFYYIAQPGDSKKYCILEMDDAVLGEVAGTMNVQYAFVRNVSDTIVPDKTINGESIPAEVQQEWSALVYNNFGFYTSYNGALSAWATIAAM